MVAGLRRHGAIIARSTPPGRRVKIRSRLARAGGSARRAGRVVIGVGADEIGVNGAYFRVHHFARQGAAPMPIPVLAAIAARTRHIEVGTGVIDMR